MSFTWMTTSAGLNPEFLDLERDGKAKRIAEPTNVMISRMFSVMKSMLREAKIVNLGSSGKALRMLKRGLYPTELRNPNKYLNP